MIPRRPILGSNFSRYCELKIERIECSGVHTKRRGGVTRDLRTCLTVAMPVVEFSFYDDFGRKVGHTLTVRNMNEVIFLFQSLRQLATTHPKPLTQCIVYLDDLNRYIFGSLRFAIC